MAQAAIISLIAVKFFFCQSLAIDGNISKHGPSTLFDELCTALGAGDGNLTAPPRNAQLLATMGAAIIMVLLALLKTDFFGCKPAGYFAFQFQVFEIFVVPFLDIAA